MVDTKRVTVGIPGIFKVSDINQAGLLKNDTTAALQARVADTSYSNDSLAELIARAWVDQPFHDQLVLDPAFAKAELEQRGIYLKNPVVIDEDQYFDGIASVRNANEVIFVVPKKERADQGAAKGTLLETARLLMACTPHGI